MYHASSALSDARFGAAVEGRDALRVRDHPYARFRPIGARDHAADVVRPDRDRFPTGLLCVQSA
jgi:hypothetical protein